MTTINSPGSNQTDSIVVVPGRLVPPSVPKPVRIPPQIIPSQTLGRHL
ncbi:MAG TPA: hypothetical protein VI037_07520 [Nitrososphaera sp.]